MVFSFSIQREQESPSGCLPFACVLGALWGSLHQANQALIPSLALGIIGKGLGCLQTFEPHDGKELANHLDVSEQLPRQISLAQRGLMALPVLMQSNHGI